MIKKIIKGHFNYENNHYLQPYNPYHFILIELFKLGFIVFCFLFSLDVLCYT